MALPVILIDSATGSNTAASGAGPTPAVGVTGTASTSADGLTVTLPNVDLTNVATDGSHVVWVNDATAGARNFAKITGKANSGTPTAQVTVANAFGLSLVNKDAWIGGRRASLTGSLRLITNSSNVAGNADQRAGWVIEMASGHTESSAGWGTICTKGDDVDGPCVVRGAAGAAVLPVVTFTNNGVGFSSANSQYGIEWRDFEFRNTNATKTASYAYQQTNNSVNGMKFIGIRINHATDKFWRAMLLGQAPTGSGFVIRDCEIANCASIGLEVAANISNSFFRHNRIHDNGGDGINFASGGTCFMQYNEIFNNGGWGIFRAVGTATSTRGIYSNNTIRNNTSGGISWGPSVTTGGAFWFNEIANNVITNNGGWGLNFTGASMTLAAIQSGGMYVAGNQFFQNTLGAVAVLGVDTPALYADSLNLDPQYTSTTDLRIGPNLRGSGVPATNNPGTSYRGYVTPGADVPLYDPPAVGNVRAGTVYDNGAKTGTMTEPAVTNVRTAVQYGAGGTEFTGTFVPAAAENVRSGIQYGAGGTEFTGTLVLPPVGQVRAAVGYGAGGAEFVGTVTLPAVGHVRAPDGYGAGGSEFVGTEVLPAVGNVTLGTGYGAAGAEFTGTFVCPAVFIPRPALAVDSTGLIATVSNSDPGATNTIYVHPSAALVGPGGWLVAGTRTGDGNVAMVLGDGYYWGYVLSDKAGVTAASNLYYFKVGNPADLGSLELLHSPADVLRYVMIGLGLGTRPALNQPWPISVGSDAAPDNMVVLTNTPGRSFGQLQTSGESVGYPGVQVRVRSTTEPSGYVKAAAVGRLLTRQARNYEVTLDGLTYRVLNVVWDGNVNELGRETDSTRFGFSLNVLVPLVRIS